MDATSVGILNSLLGQYQTATGQIESQSILLAKDLFNSLVLITLGIWFIQRLLNRHHDQAESNIELVKMIIYMNVFYMLISNYDQFLPLIVRSFKAAAPYLGQNVTGFTLITNPGQVMNTGVSLFTTLLKMAASHLWHADLLGVFVSAITALLVLFAFMGVAMEVLLIEIGSRIILTAGIMMLAFSASEWTRDYASKYINSFFSIGLKMMFIYLILGMAGGVTAGWVNTLAGIPGANMLQADGAILVASYAYWCLVTKLPDQAVGYLTGGHGINFGQNSVGLQVGGAVGGLAMQGFKYGRTRIPEVLASRAGEKLANDTAKDFAKQELSVGGKTPTDKQVNDFVTKTMGEAKRSVQEERRSVKISTTFEGQVAQKIKEFQEKAILAREAKADGKTK
jgi:type IV secretion system protein TrbL